MAGLSFPSKYNGELVITNVKYDGCDPEDTNVQEGMILVTQMGTWDKAREHPNGVGFRKYLDGESMGMNRVRTDTGEIDLAISGKLYIDAEPVED